MIWIIMGMIVIVTYLALDQLFIIGDYYAGPKDRQETNDKT